MRLAPYRELFQIPGFTKFLLLTGFAQIPTMAMTITITMHIVIGLKLGYAAAGLVSSLIVIGLGLGSSLIGHLTDRKGVRVSMGLTISVQAG